MPSDASSEALVVKFSTPQFFNMISQERKYLSRLFTGKKILAFLNILSIFLCIGILTMLCKDPMQLTGNQFSYFLTSVCWLFAILALNAIYFFYAWHVNRTRINLEKCWDPLTGAWSSSYFEGLLDEEISRAGRYHHPLSLCLIDLDNFKSFNESYGRKRADELLQKFSTFLRGSIRTSDVLGRYDNDAFFLLFPHTDVVKAEKVLSRLSDQSIEQLDCSFRAGISSYCVGEKKSQFKLRVKSALDHAMRAGNKKILCLVGQQEGQAILEF